MFSKIQNVAVIYYVHYFNCLEFFYDQKIEKCFQCVISKKINSFMPSGESIFEEHNSEVQSRETS